MSLSVDDSVCAGPRHIGHFGNFWNRDALNVRMTNSVDCFGFRAGFFRQGALTACHVSPGVPGGDVRDHGLFNAESPGDVALEDASQKQRVDLADFSFRQCRQPLRMHAASHTCRHTSEADGVLDVVLLGAERQVLRPTACLDVTEMLNLKPVRRADMPFVRDDVRAALLAVEAEGAVAIAEQGGYPDPAGSETGDTLNGIFQDLGPETGAIGLGSGYTHHVGTSSKVLTMPPAAVHSAGASSCPQYSSSRKEVP